MLYLWLKAFHIIAVIAWMAGLLYLPRLFVYHADAEKGSVQSETFKVMEGRLLRIIMNPAMILTWLFGLSLAYVGSAWSEGWLHAKMILVVAMSALHGMMVGWVRAFAKDSNRRPARFYRIANEVPTVLMVLIVILAVLKPF
jgi:putative membrane protein